MSTSKIIIEKEQILAYPLMNDAYLKSVEIINNQIQDVNTRIAELNAKKHDDLDRLNNVIIDHINTKQQFDLAVPFTHENAESKTFKLGVFSKLESNRLYITLYDASSLYFWSNELCRITVRLEKNEDGSFFISSKDLTHGSGGYNDDVLENVCDTLSLSFNVASLLLKGLQNTGDLFPFVCRQLKLSKERAKEEFELENERDTLRQQIYQIMTDGVKKQFDANAALDLFNDVFDRKTSSCSLLEATVYFWRNNFVVSFRPVHVSCSEKGPRYLTFKYSEQDVYQYAAGHSKVSELAEKVVLFKNHDLFPLDTNFPADYEFSF